VGKGPFSPPFGQGSPSLAGEEAMLLPGIRDFNVRDFNIRDYYVWDYLVQEKFVAP
jgi:hypothetical protein